MKLRCAILTLVCLLLAPNPAMAKSIDYYAGQVEQIMTGKRITDMMGVAMRLKEAGGSYQQDLTYPLEAGIHDAEAMRVLIGVRQFDALYAAAFGKRQDVALFLKAQEALILKLNLKGRVDVSAVFPPELNWMAREPDKVDFHDIVAAYADNASRYTNLTADPAGFDVIADSLFGFAVEGLYVIGLHAIQAEGEPAMAELLNGMEPCLEALGRLYGTFEDSRDYAAYVDPDMFLEKGSRLGWIRQVAEFIQRSGSDLSIHEITAIAGFAAVQRKALH